MMGPVPNVEIDWGRKRVEVGRWGQRATLSSRACLGRQVTEAILPVRKGVNLLLVIPDDDRTRVHVQAWEGEPDDSEGLSVVTDAVGAPIGIARIPLCSCGDRGCGNAGVQLSYPIAASVLPALVDLLDSLPSLAETPRRDRAWLGDLDELPEPVRTKLAGT
jgi:hypothetical protein